MLRIDSHQHFWKYDAVRDSWITQEMAAIRKDFLPGEFEPVLKENGFDGSVIIQSDQSEEENEFQLKNAEHDFVKGVVGWVDFASPIVEERLEYYSQFRKMKGFRHVLQAEKDRAYMLQPAFMKGIGLLEKYGFSYDILIFPDQLKPALRFVRAFPKQLFIIDHIAKPHIKDKQIDEWKVDLEAIARFENVYCKISGMVTEADWKQWKKEDFFPYLETVIEAFGPERILFGSDWPVCLVAASYPEMKGIVEYFFSSYSPTEQELFFGGNAIKFYNLK